MSSESLLFLFPVLAALIGWLTNFVAVKMLFHPQRPIEVLGFSIQGVFPKRQSQLADKLGDLVANELFRVDQISQKIESFALSEENMNAVGNRIEKTIRGKLINTFPMLSMFLTDEMIQKVTLLFRAELEDFVADSVKQLTENFEKNLDVRKIRNL